MTDQLEQILGPILNSAPKPTMGEGDYAYSGKGPRGWDYDTLSTVMDEMGYRSEDLNDKNISELLTQLEEFEADNNDDAIPVIANFIQSLDWNNSPIAGLLPLNEEDEENGYWDALNRGNGRGESFIMRDGERTPADPVGNGIPAGSPTMLAQYVDFMSDDHYTGPYDQASLIKELLRWAGEEQAARER